MDSHSRRFQHHSLLITEQWRYREELLFRQKHLLAPASPDGLWIREYAILTEIIVANLAGTTGRLHLGGEAIGTILQDHPISNMQALDIFTDLNHLAQHLMAQVHVTMTGQSSRSDPKVAIAADEMEITAADACEAIAHTDPIGGRQGLSGHIQHTQWRH